MADYKEEIRDGVTLDVLTDEAAGLRVAVNRLGAEMVSLARRGPDGKWHGFLYRDGIVTPPASGWANHATVMGYFLHRLWEEKSDYRGHVIHGGTHGFLRHLVFGAPTVTATSLVYHVSTDAIPPEAYPYRVALDLEYVLDANGLRVKFAFQNNEPDLDAHVSFGIHPGFAVSSPRTCRIGMPVGVYDRYMAPGNFLDGRIVRIVHEGGDMPFDREKLPDSYLLGLGGLNDRTFHLEDDGLGHRVVLDFSEVPFLTLWSDMNPYICIEPCWGLPDSKPPKPFEHKAGIQVIPAGGSLRRAFGIQPDLL